MQSEPSDCQMGCFCLNYKSPYNSNFSISSLTRVFRSTSFYYKLFNVCRSPVLKDLSGDRVQVLTGLMKSQSVEYEFGFYKLPQLTDAPVTILSVGTTLFKPTGVDIVLPLQPTSDVGEHPKTLGLVRTLD